MRRLAASTVTVLAMTGALAAGAPAGAATPVDVLPKAGCASGHDGLRCSGTTGSIRELAINDRVCSGSIRRQRACVLERRRRPANPLGPPVLLPPLAS